MDHLKDQLRRLREEVALKPDEIDTSKIVPIFVPAKFFDYGNWLGPHRRLRARAIGLTWAVLFPGETMRYVDFGMTEHWEAQSLDWKALALKNLTDHSGDTPGSHVRLSADGQIESVGLMHPDTIGPSRLLLRDRLAAAFPLEYRVALPEMSCAFAFSVNLADQEKSEIDGLIDRCYRNGTRPLAPGDYAPEELFPEEM
jgi:hypothetical protein